ncbi:Ig-like domain-containing protein [Xanthomonas arboricola]|uniref:Ig-like domain-containing protein n=1 Tax=Xanthomonas arboricola TaxID=56448 RepID=UPI000F8ED0BD|nr:Ig-like domain-containing protein [Xanthomonas arboricola]
MERLGDATFNDYLSGTKVQPIAFSDDFTRAYVGGNGVIYVIDTVTFRIFQTIPVTGGKNITSLVAAGGKLLVGEGATSGVGAGNYQLRVVDIDPTSKTFRQVISVQGTGIEASVYGVAAMEIGPDGHTLIVAVPKNANSTQLGDKTKRGDVLIFDLTTLVMATGRIAPAIVAALDGDGISGKSPQRIVATTDADHYLVTNVADYSRGLSTLVLSRDSSGNVTSATLTAIDLSQPLNAIISDRLDIQRAQSVVMVVRDGVEYAIVSDDHYNFNDPYYRAMFEAPDFLYPPYGPPVAYGGSASAKKVSVGGKLGIIRDPFGKQGTAQYLGATLPLDGYGIINLSLTADGTVLVGQLKGGFGTVDPSRQNPNLVHSWSIDALLDATLAMSDKERQSHHIAIDEPGEQNIPVKASPPAGTEISTGAETITRTSFLTGSGLTSYGAAVNAMSLTIPGASHAQTYVTIDVDSTIAQFLKAGVGSEPLTSHTLVITAGGSATLSVDAKTILEMYPGNTLSTKTADELYGGQITVTTMVNGEKTIRVYQIVRWVNLTDAVAVLKMVDPNNVAFKSGGFFGTDGALYNETPDYAGVQFQNTLADGAGGQVRTKEVQVILPSSMTLSLSDNGANGEFGFGPGTAVTAGTASWTFDPDSNGTFTSGASSYSFDTLSISNADGTTIGSLNVRGKKTKQVVANLNFTGFKAEMVRIFTTPGLFFQGPPGTSAGTGWYYYIAAAQLSGNQDPNFQAGDIEVSSAFLTTYAKFINQYKIPAPGAALTTLQVDFDNAVSATFADLMTSMQAMYASMGNGIKFITDAPAGITTWTEGPSIKWGDTGKGVLGYVVPHDGLRFDTKRGYGSRSGWLDSVLQTGTPGAPAIPEMAKEWALTDAVNQNIVEDGNVSIGRFFDWGGLAPLGAYIASITAHEFGHTFGLGEGYLVNSAGVVVRNSAMTQANLMNAGDPGYTRLGFTAEQQAILQSAVGVQPSATTSTGLTPLAATIAFYKQYYNLSLSASALPNIPTTYVAPVGPLSIPSASSPEQFAVVPEATMLTTQETSPATPVALTTEWTARGDVDIASGRLVIREAVGSQSRVGKVFIVGATDRFLRFTIDAASLQEGSGIPQDAFEALLLDAATGQSVAGAIALSRTDALLNLQGDGQAFLAQGVTFKTNADGSRTYLIDISGLAAGTAVALSFDILGFGALGSEVVVSDIALMADPHALDDALTTNEDAVAHFDVLGNDTSTAGSRVVVVTPPTHGTLKMRDDGSFDYTPDALWWGQDAFTYLLDNGKVQSNVATVSIDVRKVNHVPSIGDASVSLQQDGSVAIDLSRHATDLDGDTLDYRIVDGPLHGSVVRQPDGTFLYTANPGFHGEDSFTFVANDGQLDSSVGTVRLQVQHVNHAPVAQDATLPSLEEQALDGNLMAWVTDRDGDALMVELVSGPAHGNLVLNPDGSFHYVPDALFRGQDVFTYRVSDGLASSAIATVTIVMAPVNHLPTAADVELRVQGDGAVSFDPLAHAADVDGDTLGVIVVDGPSHGTLIRQTDGSYTYRPDTYYAGNDHLTFVVDDGTGRSQLATVTFTVLPLNHAATAANDTATTDQGVPVVIAVLSNDSDIDNTTGLNANTPKAPNAGLTARIAVPPAHGTLVVNTDGTLTYTPDDGFVGTDTFAYVANDGELDSAVASVSITVRQTNHAPIAANDAYTTVQGQPLVFVPTSNDTDVDGDRLRTIIVNGPVHGKLVWGSDGSLTYTADADFVGTDTLTYQASDGKSLSNVATVRLTVSAANQAPVAVNDSVRVHNNQTARIDVLANDRDADGDALKASIVSAPKHGTLTRNTDGTFSYSADCLFTGTDTFTYVVNDGKANSSIATVTVTVLGPNLPPLAFDDVVDLKENGSVRIDPTADDWDINGDDLQAVLVCGPSHGSLSLNPDGTYTYTPDANWYGLDGFTYQAFDGQYRSNPAMVWIRVAPVNQAPVAAADAFTVRAGVATRLDVLANDSDVDGDSLTAKLASSPKNGTLTRNRDGSFSYTAKSGFVGTDTFTYVATDGALDSRPVTVSITVLAPNRAPVAKDDKATTMAGAAVRIDVLGNDTDADGDRLAALLVCAPSHGKLTLNADGSYTYTPDKGWYGTDSFSYRATDGDAQSGVAMVSITVQKVNRAPTAQSASFQVQKDGSVRIDFDCLVNDPDGDALTLSLTNPSKGSLTRNRDGSYTYRPKSGFIGTDTFTYSVSDGKLTASASITLVVSKNPPRDNAMSIVVGASASVGSVQGDGYIVVNLGASSQPVIDWTATAGTYPTGLGNTGWAALLGGAVSGIDLLVAQTGLVVRRD